MKLWLKAGLCSIGALCVGFGTMFGIQGIGQNSSDNSNAYIEEELPETPQTRLLSNVMSMSTFQVDGVLEIKLADNTKVNVDIDVKGDINDLENIAICGDFNLDLNGLPIPASFGYFDSTMYFNYRENYFKLATDHLLDFVSMLPEYGISMQLPDELSNLDLNSITSMINGMDEGTSPDGGKYFVLALSEDVNLYVKTDESYQFKGIRTDHINLNGTRFYLNLDLTPVTVDSDFLVSPKDNGTDAKYQDFKPVFDMVNGFYNTFGKNQNTIRLHADLDKKVEDLYEDVLSTNLDFSYDVMNSFFSIEGEIMEGERHFNFGTAFDTTDIYVGINELKLDIKADTIYDIVDFALAYVSKKYMDQILDSVTKALNSSALTDAISGMDNLLDGINVRSNEFEIKLDTDAIGLGLGVLTPTITFDYDHIESISLHGLNIKGYKLDLDISAEQYKPMIIVKEEYQEFEPALEIVSAILPLIEKTEFRLEFDANVKTIDGSKKDVNIDGGLQFDIDDKFGYGQATIVDRNDYKHNVKVDMKSPDEMLFSYNNELNGKFNSQTLLDMFDLVVDIVKNPDEHFYELFGDLIDSLMNTPIMRIIGGDYGLAMETNILNSLTTSETSTKMNISLDIIGLDNTMDIEINYHKDDIQEKCFLDGIKVSNLVFDGTEISFNAYLKDFEDYRESERLDPYTEYLDFSDIKVLLELGINTSKFEYFHFNVDLDLSILSIINKTIPMDVKIRNNKGHVQVAAEIDDIPLIPAVNKDLINLEESLNSRKASLYYDDGTFYIKRVDNIETGILFWKKYYHVTSSQTCDVDYFLENILEIFLKNMLGMSDSIMKKIVGDGSSGISTGDSDSQIRYEKILKNFEYNSSSETFLFQINLGELVNTTMLDTADLTVYSNDSELTGLKASLTVHVLINIDISLNVTLTDKDASLNSGNELTELNSWARDHVNDGSTFREVSRVQY